MKKTIITLGLALAISLVSANGASAASYSLFGDAEIVSGGNPGSAAQLRSDADPGFGGVELSSSSAPTFADLQKLSTDYKFTAGSCGGGAPRFSVGVTNGTDTGNIFVYIGPPPGYAGCPPGVWTNTGDLLEGVNPIDTSQLDAGTFYDPYATALTKYGSYTVTGIDLVTDAGWLFGTQTVLVDNVMVNNDVVTFEPNTPQSRDQCKNGGYKNLEDANRQPFKNQGQCVSYFNHNN